MDDEDDKFYWRKEWHIARAHVLRRDNWTCKNCGHYGKHEKNKLRVDHIYPRKTHPELELVESNLRTLCSVCDNKRHASKGGGRAAEREARPLGVDGSPIGEGWV